MGLHTVAVAGWLAYIGEVDICRDDLDFTDSEGGEGGSKVGVLQHGALGVARCATGVANGGQVLCGSGGLGWVGGGRVGWLARRGACHCQSRVAYVWQWVLGAHSFNGLHVQHFGRGGLAEAVTAHSIHGHGVAEGGASTLDTEQLVERECGE